MTKKEERLRRRQEKLEAELARLEGMRVYERKYGDLELIVLRIAGCSMADVIR